jgi:hypothetical protein
VLAWRAPHRLGLLATRDDYFADVASSSGLGYISFAVVLADVCALTAVLVVRLNCCFASRARWRTPPIPWGLPEAQSIGD